MNKIKNNKSHYLSIIAIAISLIAIASSFIRAERIDIEGASLLGWLIGILAILVTFLVGWQIYVFIDIKHISKETRADMEDIKQLASYDYSKLSASIYAALAEFYKKQGDAKECFTNNLLALKHEVDMSKSEHYETRVRTLMDCLPLMGAVGQITKSMYCETIVKIKDRTGTGDSNISRLFNGVQNMKVTEDVSKT